MMRLIVEYIQAIYCSSDADSTCMSVLDVDLVVV